MRLCMLACLSSKVPDNANCAVSMLVQVRFRDKQVNFTHQARTCVFAATHASGFVVLQQCECSAGVGHLEQ